MVRRSSVRRAQAPDAQPRRSLRVDEVTRKLLPHVRPNERVLDLGAGTGRIARRLRDVKGIEPTLADVVHNNDTDLPYIPLSHDPYHVPAPDRSFDVVLLLFVLHHVRTDELQQTVLRECRRLARRAVLVMEDTPEGRLERRVNTAWDWVLNAYLGIDTPFTFRTTDEWTGCFGELGFRTTHVDRYRPLWPTLKTYHHTFFVLEPDDR